MRNQLFAVLSAAGVVATPLFAQEIPKTNCDLGQPLSQRVIERREALNPGPFHIVSIHCQPKMPFPNGARPAVTISPDTSSIAVIHRDQGGQNRIAISKLSSPSADSVFTNDVWTLAGGLSDGRGAFRWSADSKALWSANQERMRPRGGWAVAPVRAVRVEDGMARELPELTDQAGQLDALLWAEDGRALALFGLRGDYYRPEIPNPNPAAAFVDAVNGRVIDSLPFSSIGAATPEGSPKPLIGAAEVTTLSDGRLRAFLDINSAWIVWTQGEAPRLLTNPYREKISTAISSDGNRLLIVRENLRMAAVCTDFPPRGCETTGPAVEGVFAALHDLQTGNVIWSRRQQISTLTNAYPVPALSDDGRYGLIALPDGAAPFVFSVALVSTLDGSVEQVFPVEAGQPEFGFVPGSRRIWIHNGTVTSVYEAR